MLGMVYCGSTALWRRTISDPGQGSLERAHRRAQSSVRRPERRAASALATLITTTTTHGPR